MNLEIFQDNAAIGISLAILALALLLIILHTLFYPAIKCETQSLSNLSREISLSDETIPNNSDKDELHFLSLIIPAYNEEERLPIMLNKTINFLHSSKKRIFETIQNQTVIKRQSFEIIIVDDGSTDYTRAVVQRYAKQEQQSQENQQIIQIRLIQMLQNCGKGAAIQTGMLQSRAHFCLMVDADGATEIQDLLTLLQKLNDLQDCSFAVICGSRAHLQEESISERTLLRSFLMHAFHFFVENLCSKTIRDTQCGFKLFTRNAAILLFSQMHLRRWAFDIELVTMAELLAVPIAEVGVHWKEVEGSKLDTSKLALALISIGMLRDMLCVSICYSLGIWKLRAKD